MKIFAIFAAAASAADICYGIYPLIRKFCDERETWPQRVHDFIFRLFLILWTLQGHASR